MADHSDFTPDDLARQYGRRASDEELIRLAINAYETIPPMAAQVSQIHNAVFGIEGHGGLFADVAEVKADLAEHKQQLDARGERGEDRRHTRWNVVINAGLSFAVATGVTIIGLLAH